MKTTVNKTQSFFKGTCVKSPSLTRTQGGEVAFKVLGLLLLLVLKYKHVIIVLKVKSAPVILV